MTLINDAQKVSVGNTITVIIGRLSFPKSTEPGVQIILVYLARGYRDYLGDVCQNFSDTGNCHGGVWHLKVDRRFPADLTLLSLISQLANKKILFGVYHSRWSLQLTVTGR